MGDKQTDVEKAAKIREEIEKEEGAASDEAQAYFTDMGINPAMTRNDFTVQDALQTFVKAKDAFESRRKNKALMTNLLDKSWQIFKLLT